MLGLLSLEFDGDNLQCIHKSEEFFKNYLFELICENKKYPGVSTIQLMFNKGKPFF